MKRFTLWAAVLLALLFTTPALAAVKPADAVDEHIAAQLAAIHNGEQVNIRVHRLINQLTNGAKGSIPIYTALDDIAPLAPSGTDGWVLTYDTATNQPLWAAPDTTTFTGTLVTTNGGTGQSTWTQGDVPYYTSGTALSKLGKSTRPLVALRNTGTSNAPAWGPMQGLLYASLTESAAHDGTTAAETTIMPATAEGTAATDIGTANMLAGATFEYQVWVDATGDADGDETLTVNVYFGAQLVGTTGAIAVDGATDLLVTGTVNLEAAGAAVAGNYFSINNSYPGVATTTAATFAAFNTTATQAFAVKLDWGGTTDAADTAKVQMAHLYLCNFD